jgi:hypothetical protein
MNSLINTSFLALALATHSIVASAKSSPSSSSSSQRLGIFSGDGTTFVQEESPVRCLMHFVEPYMIDPDADEK